MRKGFANLQGLIMLLVFLIVLLVAVIPIISSNINTTSTTTNLAGTNIFTISALSPLMLALGGIVTIVYVLFSGG